MPTKEEYIAKSSFFKHMIPNDAAVVEERKNDFIWFDDKDVLYSVPKDNVEDVTMEESLDEIRLWEERVGDKKYCMISVVNPHAKSSKEQRDWAAEVLPKYVTAIALISNSALGRMAIKLFVGLRPPTYPLKVFKDYESAKEWLDQYSK
jgi:hypothetical protein